MSTSSYIAASTPYALTASQPDLTAGTGSTDAGQNIDAVSKDFEAVFLTQMMSAMFAGDDTSAYFGGGTSGDVYKSYLLNEYGKSMAQAGGIGIAASVKQELLKLQEVQS
jgi:Rod binding domain-containing protein